MADRGEYRPFNVALRDDPEFQRTTPFAKVAHEYLILNLGRTGIGAIYPGMIEAQTGLTAEQLLAAYAELEGDGSRAFDIRREGFLVWVVHRLADERSLDPKNANHAKGVQTSIATLPQRSALVQAFRRHYTLWFPNETPHAEAPSTPNAGAASVPRESSTGHDQAMGGPRESNSANEELPAPSSETNGDLPGEREAGPATHTPSPAAEPRDSLASAREAEPPRDATTRPAGGQRERPAHPPTLDEVLQLPGVRAYLAAHFGAVPGTKLAEGAKSALKELHRTLVGGAKIENNRPVRAVDGAHLSWACEEVAAMRLRTPQSANRIVLKKLEESYVEVRKQREDRTADAEDAERQRQLHVALAWLDQQPGVREAIERSIAADYPKARCDANKIFDMARQAAHESRILEAFRASVGEVAAPPWLPEAAAA